MGRGDKSYLRPVAPSPGPRGPPGHTPWGHLSLDPGAEKAAPPSPLLWPWPWPGASAPLRGPGRSWGSLTCGELAAGRPQQRPRGQEQDRHPGGQRRRRRIHVDFGRSFFQAALQRAARRIAAKSTAGAPAGPRGVRSGRGGEPPAARPHFPLLRGSPTRCGAPGRLASPGGRGGGGSPWLGGRGSRSPGVTLLGEGRGRSRGVTSPRGLRALRRNAGSGAAPPPPAGETRAGRAARPAPRSPPPLFRARPRRSEGARAVDGDPAGFTVHLQKAEFEIHEFGKQCGQTPEDPRRQSPRALVRVPRSPGPRVPRSPGPQVERSQRSGCA